MNNPLKHLTKKEWALWICSLAVVMLSNTATKSPDPLTLLAALIGVTSLIFAAKGNVWAQVLMIIFSILYGMISFRFRYYGEMITYLGMTLPMAVWATITWLKNPAADHNNTVAIRKINPKQWAALLLLTAPVTAIMYVILHHFQTPNIFFSTVSVSTSFLAAALTMLRSSFYALGYVANDLVLIVLWVLASFKNAAYIPVAVNFTIFLINDLYGFYRWRKREQQQA